MFMQNGLTILKDVKRKQKLIVYFKAFLFTFFLIYFLFYLSVYGSVICPVNVMLLLLI